MSITVIGFVIHYRSIRQEPIPLILIVCRVGERPAFYFEVDGKSAGQIVESPEDEWSVYSHSVKVTNVQLSEGRHVLRWCTTGSMNLDKFVFTRTGEYTGDKSRRFSI